MEKDDRNLIFYGPMPCALPRYPRQNFDPRQFNGTTHTTSPPPSF